ncbi:MAG: methyltransferase family protein [Promethearchaeota archaeon]
MIETLTIQIFFIIVIFLFLLGFIWPLIIVKKRGKNPHGTHEGASILTKLSGVSIFFWLGLICFYFFFPEIIKNIVFFNLFYSNIAVIIGMIIISIGFLFELMGIIALGENFRIELPIEKIELITSGIYKFMRNPIVFGIFLLVAGTFMIIPNILTLISMIFNILTFNSKAKDEETFLTKTFGEKYLQYKNKVGRYLPFNIKKNII